MRIFSLLLIFFLVVTSGDAEAAKRKRTKTSGGGGGTHVFLLRGIFNVSVGLDALAQKLTRRGIRATVYGHGESGTVAAQAAAEYRAGRSRIILVGHSLGAGGAVMAADTLNQAGVPVALLVSLDPVASLQVPGNVRRAVNYYTTSGVPMSGAGNVNMAGVAGIDHMSIQSLDMMHQRILGAIGGR